MTIYPVCTIRASLWWRSVSMEDKRDKAIEDSTKFNMILLDSNCCGVKLKLNASPMKLNHIIRMIITWVIRRINTRHTPEGRQPFTALHVRIRVAEGVDVFRVMPVEAG